MDLESTLKGTVTALPRDVKNTVPWPGRPSWLGWTGEADRGHDRDLKSQIPILYKEKLGLRQGEFELTNSETDKN